MPWRGVPARLAWAALIGLQFGLFEIVRLERGGFELSLPDLVQIAAVHCAFAAVAALPAALAAAPIETRWGARPAAAITPAWTLLVLLGLPLNKLLLPALLSLPSLLGNAALLLALGLLGLLWSRRAWSRSTDRLLLTLLLAADLALLAGAASGEARRPEATGSGGGGGGPDLVLILIDTLRADHLPIYGYGRPTAPRLEALAAAGLVFDNAYSTSNWTRPAVASLFTSAMPSRHGVVRLDRAVPPALPLLAEVLSRAGYQTGAFSSGPNVEPADGYGRGVDHFFHADHRSAAGRTFLVRRVLSELGKEREWDPGALTDRALAWLGRIEAEPPIFLYVHYLGPHDPYLAPPPYDRAFSGREADPSLAAPPGSWAGSAALSGAEREQMVAQYDAEILWHDAEVGRLLDGLRAAGRLERAAVLVTSDHGEGFGEHGVWGHGAGIFDEVARIPFVLRCAEPWCRPRRIATPVSLIDVAPTFVELASAEAPPGFDGASLVPWLRDGLPRRRTVFIENPENEEGGLRDGDWAYFEGRTPEGFRSWLYRAADARQEEELSALFPELLQEYRAVLAERRRLDVGRAAPGLEIELDEERRERLRALGYLQ